MEDLAAVLQTWFGVEDNWCCGGGMSTAQKTGLIAAEIVRRLGDLLEDGVLMEHVRQARLQSLRSALWGVSGWVPRPDLYTQHLLLQHDTVHTMFLMVSVQHPRSKQEAEAMARAPALCLTRLVKDQVDEDPRYIVVSCPELNYTEQEYTQGWMSVAALRSHLQETWQYITDRGDVLEEDGEDEDDASVEEDNEERTFMYESDGTVIETYDDEDDLPEHLKHLVIGGR
jgi:hypothetical protein